MHTHFDEYYAVLSTSHELTTFKYWNAISLTAAVVVRNVTTNAEY